MPITDQQGVIAVYRLKDGKLVKVEGRDVSVDLDKLAGIIEENKRIAEQQASELGFLEPLRGFAMVVDDLGLAVIDNYVVFADARKVNWDSLLKSLLKGVVVSG